ncbi:LeuA family protein [Halorussus halophilus]|uniref:LeuA family protein n=1 Tax=Halorussus halophilus TaxID=2650975 RepID=UPI0013014BB8|nr:LeuA family protein [Halorussus halophilus]
MKLLDVTLREGEQRAGTTYTVEQKVEAAELLSLLGVEYVQIGFPVADDRTHRVCETLDIEAKTTGIARVIDADIDAAVDAGVDVIDCFAPTSDRQRTQLLDVERDELQRRIDGAIDRAHETGHEVHFTAMDGFRTSPDVLAALAKNVGAEYVTVADTVGGTTPGGVRETLNALDSLGVDFSTLGVHFHDDLGVATANALVAAEFGVGKVDVSVAGVGERAGNTALEEFVVSGAVGPEPVEVSVERERLLSLSRSILDTLGEKVPPGKSLLGRTAFQHESGLHTAAMLDDPATFEPFDPATFGGERTLLFGAATGRGGARRLLERADREPTAERIDRLLDALRTEGGDLELVDAVALAKEVE